MLCCVSFPAASRQTRQHSAQLAKLGLALKAFVGTLPYRLDPAGPEDQAINLPSSRSKFDFLIYCVL